MYIRSHDRNYGTSVDIHFIVYKSGTRLLCKTQFVYISDPPPIRPVHHDYASSSCIILLKHATECLTSKEAVAY